LTERKDFVEGLPPDKQLLAAWYQWYNLRPLCRIGELESERMKRAMDWFLLFPDGLLGETEDAIGVR